MSKKKPEKLLFEVTKGCLKPYDGYTQQRLREKGYRIGDVLSAVLSKPRNPKFHRLVHAFGQLLAENLDAFEGMEAHACLKRIQWEAGIGCEEMGVMVPGVGYANIRIPQSLSYANMDEGQFTEIFRDMCRWVAKTYWKDMTEDQIAAMAEMIPSEG